MKSKLLIITCFVLIAVVFSGIAHAQDERTAKNSASGFYVGLMPGSSMDYHIPSTYFDGKVIYLVGTPSYCTVWIYTRSAVGSWLFYDDFTITRGQTVSETNVYPGLYCNPADTLDAYSNYKVRVYSVNLPMVKTSRNPYIPQLTPYP